MSQRRTTTQANTVPMTASVKMFAIDLAKHVFQVAGEDAHGTVVFEHRYRSREAFFDFVRNAKSGQQAVMETGPGAQAWARELIARGVQVRILPAQRVAEHRSGPKNDRNDALALLRAARDTSIHEVPIKSAERLALQAVHRVRHGYVRRRTALANQARGLLLEQGMALARGEQALIAGLRRALADATVPLPDRLRELLADLWAEWETLGQRIERLSADLAQRARHDGLAHRLMRVPGIGPVTASALVCKELVQERYAGARAFAASFGLVPDQHSSGQRVRLGKMSRRGDAYLRSLLIEGAQSVLRRVNPDDPSNDRLHRWLRRHGRKGAAVRLANRNLRIVWHLLPDGASYRHAEPTTTSSCAEASMN